MLEDLIHPPHAACRLIMLSFVAALLRSDSQQYASEFDVQERAKVVFAECDANLDGKLSKQDIYNYFVDQRVNLSHLAQEKLFKQLSGGSESLTLQQFLQATPLFKALYCMAVQRCFQPVCLDVTLFLDVVGSQQVQQDLGRWPGRISTKYCRHPLWYVSVYSRVSQTCNSAALRQMLYRHRAKWQQCS